MFRPSRNSASTRFRLFELEQRVNPAGRPLPLPFIFAGVGEGAPPRVRAYHADTGALAFERTPFDAGFAGGVRVAAGDVNHDTWPDLIAAAGSGGGPHVKVLDGKTGEPIAGPLGSFFAYDKSFKGGLSVASGDADGDGWADVITAAGKGGGPHVKVFSGLTGKEIASFFAFAPEFNGGATVAAADFTGDHKVDLAVGAGEGGKSQVRVFDLSTGKTISGPLGDFYAFDKSFKGGVSVGTDWLTGDVNGDKQADLVVGAGAGGAPHVKVYDGASGKMVRSFISFDPTIRSGVRVATAFVTDDAYADIIVGSGPGSTATVKVFDGQTGAELAAPLSGYQPFGAGFTGGLFVAASNDPPYANEVRFSFSNPTTGGAFTITGVVTPLDVTGITPTGTVTFSRLVSGAWTPFGTTTISWVPPAGNAAGGSVTLNPLTWTPGFYPVKADYSGDANFSPSAYGHYLTVSPPSSSVGDFVWNDLNGDGLQDEDEPGIGGVTVLLHSSSGVAAQTTTDSDGKYEFAGLIPSQSYRVEFVNPDPDWYAFTERYAGPGDSDSNADEDGFTEWFQAPPSGQKDETKDGGMTEPGIMVVGDTDRNGSVTPADDDGRNAWTKTKGAIYAVNHDDNPAAGQTVGDEKPDAISFDVHGTPVDENFAFESEADALQSAPLEIRPIGKWPAGWKVILKVKDKGQAQAIHVFSKREVGATHVMGKIGDRVGKVAGALPPAAEIEVDITNFVSATEKRTFGVEGLLYRFVGFAKSQGAPDDLNLEFDGFIDFTVELRSAANALLAPPDSAKMKVAPWVMLSNAEASSEVWALDANTDNEKYRLNSKADDGYKGLDNSNQLQVYQADKLFRWAQDQAEIGYTQRPGGAKIYQTFRLPYGSNVAWLKDHLLGENRGVFGIGNNFFPPDTRVSGDFGGNLELMPPNATWKLGRIVVGDTMSQPLRNFLKSQEVQTDGGNLVELPVKWLDVGHIDEVISFDKVPNKVILASPDDAYTLMRAVPQANRRISLFNSPYINPKSGSVPSPAMTNPTKRVMITEDLSETTAADWKYIRIVSGAAKGQVGQISVRGDGYVEVDKVWDTTSNLVNDSAFTKPLTFHEFMAPDPLGLGQWAPSQATWFVQPAQNDEYIIVKDSLLNKDGTPVFINLNEVLDDANFDNLNSVLIKQKIDAIKAALDAAAGEVQEYITVPALYLGWDKAADIDGRHAFAFSPGLSNVQIIGGKYYFPRSYSPLNDDGVDIFEKAVKDKLGANALFVEDWTFYHLGHGEVHCGSLVKRVIWAKVWWTEQP